MTLDNCEDNTYGGKAGLSSPGGAEVGMLSQEAAVGCEVVPEAERGAPGRSRAPRGPGELEVLPRGLFKREIFFCISRRRPRMRPTKEADPVLCRGDRICQMELNLFSLEAGLRLTFTANILYLFITMC